MNGSDLPLFKLRRCLALVGGSAPYPVRYFRRKWWAISLGVAWLFLLFLVIAFVGRATRFIYVDF